MSVDIEDQPFFDILVPDRKLEHELERVSEADFIAFDERFFDVIGSNPSIENMFNLSTSLREAPVYVPSENVLFVADQGAGKLLRINLTVEPPTFEYVALDPPLEGINGAVYSRFDELIYTTVNACPSAESGIYSIDPITLQTKPLVNNFLGHHFNSPNDLAVTKDGVWFTDPPYAAILGNSSSAELRATVHFYNPKSNLLRPIDEDIQMPNGIEASVDERTLYVADSGSLCKPIGQPTVPTKHHSVYAYDIVGPGQVRNRNLFYVADQWVPDGIKVTPAGNLYSAAGIFVDIVSPDGDLMGKLRFPGIIANVAFAGRDYNELWIVGISGIFRVKIEESGPDLGKSSSDRWFIQRES
jgi:sugar lactone lactonase YvrE